MKLRGLAVAAMAMLMACLAAAQPQLGPLHALGGGSAPEDPAQAQRERDILTPDNLDEFRLLWAVTSSSAQPLGDPDDPVPVGGNVRMLYESQF